MIVPPGYYTVKQVADILNCSEDSVYRYIRKDGLPARTRRGYKRGKVVKAENLEKWVEKHFGGTDE